MDENGDIILIDFGMVAPISGRGGEGTLSTCLGTRGYMAPEFLNRLPYLGEKVDIFALGVNLFILYTREFPFGEAVPGEHLYSLISQNKFEEYW